MTQGPIAALSAVNLTPAEKQGGYSSRPTDGGDDVSGMLQSAVSDLQAAALKLGIVVPVLPAGANKTSLTALLATLTATS